MYDVPCEFASAAVRSKDAQKQLARTSLSGKWSENNVIMLKELLGFSKTKSNNYKYIQMDTQGCETILAPGNIRYAPSLVARQGRGGTNIGTDVVSMEISPCFAR